MHLKNTLNNYPLKIEPSKTTQGKKNVFPGVVVMVLNSTGVGSFFIG